MGNGIVRFSIKKVPGGSEVTAHKRSRRGTLYISQSVRVMREAKSKKEFRDEIAAAVLKMDEGRE